MSGRLGRGRGGRERVCGSRGESGLNTGQQDFVLYRHIIQYNTIVGSQDGSTILRSEYIHNTNICLF